MVTLVSADWVQERLATPKFLIIDSRGPVRYLQGHLEGAVNFPISKVFDSRGCLRAAQELGTSLGLAGLGSEGIPIIYDGYDGRNAAMLAWVLEYMGLKVVYLLDTFFEQWTAERREIFYRPVKPMPKTFTVNVNPAVRASLEEVSSAAHLRLLDLRSRDEYTGKEDTEGRPGHIPGAVNIVWQQLIDGQDRILCPREKLQGLLDTAHVERRDKVIVYCRTGVRAAIGYLGLKSLGYQVSLYDGSYAEWARNGRPVETEALDS